MRLILLSILISQPILADTILVSINKDHTGSGNYMSFHSSISGDGRYIAFSSYANNLVDNDTSGAIDIFVRDLQTSTTHLVSVNSNGTQANYHNTWPSISADGRYIAFESGATNLVDNDTNEAIDIFVHDMQTGTTHLVSVNSSGTQANGNSYLPSISADGRYIAFQSDATNLVDNDTNEKSDIFVHDLQTGTTHLVSMNSNGTQANGYSYLSSISADGRYIAFESDATNLVDNDTNGTIDIFIHDLQTGTTHLVSVNSSGAQANGRSDYPSISADGRYIVFSSDATNLVDNDTNGKRDIFIHDLQTGTTHLVSVNSNGAQANGPSYWPSISADRRYIAFQSDATNLVDNDTNEKRDVFIHDLQTGTTHLVSVNSNGTQANDNSYLPSISADGRYIAFESDATNLVNNDTNRTRDIFLYDNKKYLLSGELWGLPYQDRIVIQNNHTDILELTANGTFQMNSSTEHYTLTIFEQPQRANCMIYNPTGTIGQVRPIVRCFSRRYR